MEMREPCARYLAKPAFKQTEVGVIPEDWDVVRLTEVARLESGHTPSRRHPEYWNGSIPWVSLHDTENLEGREIQKTVHSISSEGLKNSSARLLPQGTVVFSRTATVGKVSVLGREMATSQDFANYICGPRIWNHYLVYLFRWMAPEWKRLMAGSIHNTIYMPAFQALKVALPHVTEQQAIADALGDADALIESLEHLLAKKRQIKQGTMQALLTGQQRLPGFEGAWRAYCVGEIADVKTGPFGSSLHERDYVNVGTPIVTVEHLGEFGITYQNLPRVCETDRSRLQAYSLEIGDIVFSRVGSVDRNALVREAEDGWLFSGRLLRLRPNRRYVFPAFLSYQFHTDWFRSSVIAVAVGQTMASLNTQILNGLRVFLPPVEEQTAIATVLADMDAELVALDTKLTKARALKQGMMQSLLTGRIRLI